MNKTLLAAGFLLLAQDAAAQRLIRSHANPGTVQSRFGASLASIGDFNATDGFAEYAIGAPDDSSTANGAGSVRAYDAATGALLWTTSGSGGWTPCGSPGTNGDGLGEAMAAIPDRNGDGADELVVGSPRWGVTQGGCVVPFYGRISVLDGATGAVLQTHNGKNPQDFFGMSVTRIASVNLDPVDEYAALAPGKYLRIYDGVTGSLLSDFNLQPGDAVLGGGGDMDNDGLPWELAVGNPSQATVRFYGSNGILLDSVTGTPGSDFGASVDWAPGLGVLAGAPKAAGNAGIVYWIQGIAGGGGIPPAPLPVSFGSAGDFLGTSVDYGGQSDDDPDLEFLAGAPQDGTIGLPPDFVRIADLGGTTTDDIADPNAAGVFYGEHVAWAGNIQGGGAYADFLVSDTRFSGTDGRVDVYYGGPAATLDQNFGAGCNPAGAVPTLTQSAALIPGMSFQLSISGAGLGIPGNLFVGLADPVGFTVPPCTLWLNNPILVAAPVFTDASGNWSSPVYTVPLDPSLIGLTFAHQAVLDDNGVLSLTNATSSRIGW